jgi:C-terminal processing protease CtpA/Prc
VRRAVVIVITALIACGISFAWAVTRPAVFARFGPHLPAWVQTRPSLYLESTLNVIRTQAARRDAVDWPAVVAHANELAKDAKTAAGTYPAIRYALDQLGDGHSMISPPAPANAAVPGVYGFQTLFPERVVAVVYPQSAAALAGVRAGDQIEMVNGAPPVASADARARGNFVSVPPPSATLRLRHPGEKEAHDVSLSIGPYLPLPALTRRVGGDLGYVEIPGTSGQDQFAERVRESIYQADAPAICGWIVDLRFNNGGSLWAILQPLRPILGEGPFGSFVGPDGQSRAWAYPTTGPFAVPAPEHPLQHPDPAVAVLTSRLTTGSGEVASIAFRGRPATRVFGEPTWGAPTDNTSYRLPDGALLDLATSKAADRTGHVYEGRVPPDEVVATDWARLTAPDDPGLVAAGTWLRAQPACRKK